MVHSLLKKLLVSQSSRVGPARADRELGYALKWYNDNIDVRRGVRKKDFMWGRTWSELKAKRLWTNIKGPSPGGNQHMPQRSSSGASGAAGGSSAGGSSAGGSSQVCVQTGVLHSSDWRCLGGGEVNCRGVAHKLFFSIHLIGGASAGEK